MTYRRECYICGSQVIAKAPGGRVYCSECRAEQRAERDHRRFRSSGYLGRPSGYTVIKDPDDIGGFPREAHISKYENEIMLRESYYTPGTILRSAHGILWRIFNGKKSQKLVKIYG